MSFGLAWIVGRERRARRQADVEHAAAMEARDRAEASARNAARLQRAAEALSRAISPAEVLDAVLTSGVAAAEARAGMIALLSDDRTELVVAASRGFREGLMEDTATPGGTSPPSSSRSASTSSSTAARPTGILEVEPL